jgi:hypothetical protein
MPIQTRILDKGNFVRSPESPPKAGFSEYLNFADRLLAQWRRVQEDWNRSPFSAELGSEKRELDGVLSDFVETFKALYTIPSVERDPAFLPASRFLAQYRPIRQPFSILHCDRAMPLHTILAFPDHGELAKVNAALDEDTPLRWWESGPHGRPCYLFGSWVWVLRPSEIALSEKGTLLLFLDLSERHRQQQGRLAHSASQFTANVAADFISEKVRRLVWRRAGGQCEKCGGHDGLDFSCLTPAGIRGESTPDEIQLLCGRCRQARAE